LPSPTIAARRLANQHLTGKPLDRPQDVVGWLGAVQAQDYAGAKWAIAQRMRNVSDAALDQAFAAGAILRTHVMRPTWHFVLPDDIHWLLELTAPRVQAVNASYHRKLELDHSLFRRSNRALAKALGGGQQLTRAECGRVLHEAGVPADGLRLGFLMMGAELDAVICSGARRGKQFTYALLDERAPQARKLERDEALAELAGRYFQSHGPAQVQDFVWWSGLSTADAKHGIRLAGNLVEEVSAGKSYWEGSSPIRPTAKAPTGHLLPNYDEFLVGYRDHSPNFLGRLRAMPAPPNPVLGRHIAVVDGQVVGGWRSAIEQKTLRIEARLLVSLAPAERACLQSAAERYGRFIGVPVELRLRRQLVER
jgi:winged helix DNA-binding protein